MLGLKGYSRAFREDGVGPILSLWRTAVLCRGQVGTKTYSCTRRRRVAVAPTPPAKPSDPPKTPLRLRASACPPFFPSTQHNPLKQNHSSQPPPPTPTSNPRRGAIYRALSADTMLVPTPHPVAPGQDHRSVGESRRDQDKKGHAEALRRKEVATGRFSGKAATTPGPEPGGSLPPSGQYNPPAFPVT